LCHLDHLSVHLFCSLLLRPPSSPLFPYTTLFRSTLVLAAVLFVVAESISTIVVADVKAGISPSSAVALAAVVLLGPVGAAAVGFTSCLAIRRHDLIKRLFNGAQFALVAYAAGHVYLVLGGEVGEPGREDFPAILFRSEEHTSELQVTFRDRMPSSA